MKPQETSRLTNLGRLGYIKLVICRYMLRDQISQRLWTMESEDKTKDSKKLAFD